MAPRWMAALIWRLPPRSRRWRLVLPELTGIGAMPPARGSLAAGGERCAPAISPISFPAGKGPKPTPASNCGASCATRAEISTPSASTAPVSSRRRRSSSRAILTRAVCSVRARRRPIAPDHFFETRPLPGSLSSGQRSCRCQSRSLLIATRLRTSRSRWSTSSRRSSSGPASCAAGSPSRPSRNAARATANASIASDLPRLRAPRRASAISFVATRITRSPLRQQKPLQRTRDMPAVLKRPNPLLAHRTRPIEQRDKAPLADRDRLLTEHLAGCRDDRRDRVRTLVHVCTEHNHSRCPFTSTEADSPADTACWGRYHAPIKSRRDVPDQRRATQQKQVRPNGRQPQRESARRQPESPLAAGRHRAPIQTASLDALAPLCRASRRGLLDIVMSGADDGGLHFEVARLRAW